MPLSTAQKQRLGFSSLLLVVIVLTHIAYRLINPEWVIFRQGENAYHNKEWDQAITLYEKSIAMGLQKPIVMHHIADAYVKMRNYQKAIYWYKEYLTLQPKDIGVRKAFAKALTANGEFEAAAKEYERILKDQRETKEL